MMISRRRPESGLTLLEVVIAAAILAVVLLATSAILFSTSTSSARGQTATNLGASGKEFIELCKREFYDARFNDIGNSGNIGIHDGGTQVHFQVALGMSTSGFVQFGYVGNQHFSGTPNNTINTGVNITVNGVTQTVYKQDLQAWIDYSCVIRFEPELVYYEGLTAPNLIHPGTADTSAPQEFQPNPYVNMYNLNITPVPALKNDPLPSWPIVSSQPKLDIDINRDGDKNDVFIKGKIWLYVMAPLVSGVVVKHKQVVSDNVILAVAPDGSYRGDVDGIDSQATQMRKDTLFRYLTSTPSTWGQTDVATTTAYPGNTTAAMGVTIWHGLLDESGKLFHLRKTWERVSFRLNRISGS